MDEILTFTGIGLLALFVLAAFPNWLRIKELMKDMRDKLP